MVQLGNLRRQPIVAVTIDVEWAHPAVLSDVTSLLDERGIRATYFCTGANLATNGHERAIHPNFFREGNSLWNELEVVSSARDSEIAYWRAVVAKSRAYCPEALGVRSHGLFSASKLLPIYSAAGLQYSSSAFMPLASDLRPIWRGSGMLELPIYYMDYWDLDEESTGLALENLKLEEPGLKVFCWHPNLIYANYSSLRDYEATRNLYHDPDALLKLRKGSKRGVRDLFLEMLDCLGKNGAAVATLGEINAAWRLNGSHG